jgi:hypothetical protein
MGTRPVVDNNIGGDVAKVWQECCSIMIQHPMLEKMKNNFIGWPIFKELGGFLVDDLIEQNDIKWSGQRGNLWPADLRISENDSHPNIKGHKFIGEYLTSSIIVRKGMKVWDNSWMPHTDFGTVCNLWLNDYNGGTAFYRHKKKTPPKGMTFNKKNLVDWKNFEGNDDWELFYIIPSKKNTLTIYDGTKYHGTYANLTEETRWSLISFYQEGDRTYQ